MFVCAKHFFERKSEVEVSKNLYLMQYQTDMRLLFRTTNTQDSDSAPVYFVMSENALKVKDIL
jgi:DNA phosphorothioation-dependent restriction protein DptG